MDRRAKKGTALLPPLLPLLLQRATAATETKGPRPRHSFSSCSRFLPGEIRFHGGGERSPAGC